MGPDPFLNELTKFYENQKEKGTVWVTMKRGMLSNY
jgi:signal recognition particle subunit SRP14